MEYTLTVKAPQNVYGLLVKTAEQTGLTPEEMAAQWLADAARQIEEDDSEKTNGAFDNGTALQPQPVPPGIHPENYKLLQMTAERTGRPVEELADEWVKKFAPKPRPQLTEGKREAALARLLRHAGSQDLGYPTGADNESIDADLAREYGSTHEED